MQEKKKCPKCGFYMTDNYCVKCGYCSNIYINKLEKYDKDVNDLELLMKNKYKVCVYRKNSLMIYILGPLYLCYCCYYWLGCILLGIEFLVSYFVGVMFSIGLMPVIIYYVLERILYVCFLNDIVIKLNIKKINKLKKKYDNYKNILIKKKSNSLLLAILAAIMYIVILIVIIICYKIYRGNF